MMIKEIIVVEGKDDIAAVKAAVDAQVFATGGLWFGKKTLERLKKMGERNGIILLTDPDYAGDKIRSRIAWAIPGCKHAFMPREYAIRKGDIGVENASKEAIKEALLKAHPMMMKKRETFTLAMLYAHGLIGPNSNERREKMGKILGIGYGNGKQFLERLNHFGIGEKEYAQALEEMNRE